MRIAATSPEEYVASLPGERRPHLERIRALVKKTVPEAEEKILWGMIGWEIHGRPFAAVASQKASMSLYLMDLAALPALAAEHAADLAHMARGKSCLHFLRASDLPLDVVAKILAKAPTLTADAVPSPREPASPKLASRRLAPKLTSKKLSTRKAPSSRGAAPPKELAAPPKVAKVVPLRPRSKKTTPSGSPRK